MDSSWIEINGIDIAGVDEIKVSGLFACGGQAKFDPEDFLHVYARVDGGGWTLIGAFESDLESGYNSSYFGIDADFDGIADGTDSLNTEFKTVEFALGSKGTSLYLRIIAFMTAGDEEIAFDNIMVSGVPDTDPPVFDAGYPRIIDVMDTRFKLAVSLDEPSVVWYLPRSDGAPATIPDILDQGFSFSYGTPGEEATVTIDGLSPDTEYDLYVVAEDDPGVITTS